MSGKLFRTEPKSAIPPARKSAPTIGARKPAALFAPSTGMPGAFEVEVWKAQRRKATREPFKIESLIEGCRQRMARLVRHAAELSADIAKRTRSGTAAGDPMAPVVARLNAKYAAEEALIVELQRELTASENARA